MKNLCLVCKQDMGDHNPRQLCGKTYCRETLLERPVVKVTTKPSGAKRDNNTGG